MHSMLAKGLTLSLLTLFLSPVPRVQAADRSTETTDTTVSDGQTAEYYDMQIYEEYIVFVIDISSSMFEDGPAAPNTRLAAAKKELISAVTNLPGKTQFSILAYNEKVEEWNRGKLALASDEKKADAVSWIEYLEWGRGTDTCSALEDALKVSSKVETIMFLSDGKPSRGIKDAQEILKRVRKKNKHNVTINTIGVFTGGEKNTKLIQFMKDLAAQNHGQYHQVN